MIAAGGETPPLHGIHRTLYSVLLNLRVSFKKLQTDYARDTAAGRCLLCVRSS
jgi:hypothetical protein